MRVRLGFGMGLLLASLTINIAYEREFYRGETKLVSWLLLCIM